MKKNIAFIAIVFLFGTLISNAQNSESGIFFGYSSLTIQSSSTLTGTSQSGDISFHGVYLGIFKEYYLFDKITFQPEFQLSRFGNSSTKKFGNQLNIPLLFKYSITEKIEILAGPQFDYIIEKNIEEGINKFGVGINLGVIYNYTENIFFTSRYSFGLVNRINEDHPVYIGNGSAKINSHHNIFQLGIGYRL